MTQFAIPIDTLMTQVFGLATPLLRKYELPAGDKYFGMKYAIPAGEAIADDGVMSNLGTPVIFPMTLKGGNYNITNAGVIEKRQFEDMMLPFTSVASFKRSKRSKETAMSGHKGEVIETYGFRAWEIKIEGLIINGNNKKNQTVDDQMKEIQAFEEITDAIEVGGRVFELLQISHVAIMDIEYPAVRKLNMNVVRPYRMVCRSVEPIELVKFT